MSIEKSKQIEQLLRKGNVLNHLGLLRCLQIFDYKLTKTQYTDVVLQNYMIQEGDDIKDITIQIDQIWADLSILDHVLHIVYHDMERIEATNTMHQSAEDKKRYQEHISIKDKLKTVQEHITFFETGLTREIMTYHALLNECHNKGHLPEFTNPKKCRICGCDIE